MSTARYLSLLPFNVHEEVARRGLNAESVLLVAAEIDGKTSDVSMGACYPDGARAERKRAFAQLRRGMNPQVYETGPTMLEASLRVLLQVCKVDEKEWWAA